MIRAQKELDEKTLIHLPADIYINLRNQLDNNPSDSNWQALKQAVEKDYKIVSQLRGFAPACHGSPGEMLLADLSSQDMKVKELRNYLCKICIDTSRLGLSPYEEITILKRTPSSVELLEGDDLTLKVVARGRPFPKYQWYFRKDGGDKFSPLQGQTACILGIRHISLSSAGAYSCQIYNCDVPEKTKLTEFTFVSVKRPEIEVILQPKSVTVQLGQSAVLACKAHCKQPLRYQWYKDDEKLGKSSHELYFINIQDRQVQGMYWCEISVRSVCSTKPVHTAKAFLKVDVPVGTCKIFNPSDKIALLIGNYDYKNENCLEAPSKDVSCLSKIFHALNFKVISLLNLTKSETENAVLQFCNLVHDEAYVVFYFCGHGFDEQGMSFLVPTDVPTVYSNEECVCSEMVLEHIQRKKPALVFMILDICRKMNVVRSDIPINNKFEIKTVTGNTVFCYATSKGLSAYEQEESGLLVRHLAPLLNKPIGIDDLVKELKQEFFKKSNHCCKQIPESKSNLLEPERSLTDAILCQNQGEVVQMAAMQRNNYFMEIPLSRTLTFSAVGIDVRLDFRAEFSNILDIYTSVVHARNEYEECVGYIARFTAPVSQLGEVTTSRKNNITETKITLQNIQKLRSNLMVEVVLKCLHLNRHYQVQHIVDLGLPLVSKLHLWKPQRFTINVYDTVEQADDTCNT